MPNRIELNLEHQMIGTSKLSLTDLYLALWSRDDTGFEYWKYFVRKYEWYNMMIKAFCRLPVKTRSKHSSYFFCWVVVIRKIFILIGCDHNLAKVKFDIRHSQINEHYPKPVLLKDLLVTLSYDELKWDRTISIFRSQIERVNTKPFM